MDTKLEMTEWKEIFNRGIINTGNLTRMNRVMKKAMAGEAVTIGFIGGSITAGAMSSTPQTCYAFLVYSWWKDKFPMSAVNYVNAGVGATTSKFGVARVEEDLLQQNPDIVIVEFSVNDSDNDLFQETFEGLIRKILLYQTEPALLMFNNVFYHTGVNAQRVHNQIGEFYDIPIVSMKESIYTEIEKGNIIASEISPDNLHPNDLGHKIVAGLLINRLDQIFDAAKNNIIAGSYSVPEKTVTANRYFDSIRRSGRNTNPKLKGFTKDEAIKENQWDVFKNGWFGGSKGSSICFEVEGSMISVQYCKYAKHPAPIANVVIDHNEETAIILDANFDETWGDCLFLQDIIVNGVAGKHTVEITIIEAVEDKAFYLASVITA